MEKVQEELQTIISREFKNIWQLMEQYQTDMRQAAYIHAWVDTIKQLQPKELADIFQI